MVKMNAMMPATRSRLRTGARWRSSHGRGLTAPGVGVMSISGGFYHAGRRAGLAAQRVLEDVHVVLARHGDDLVARPQRGRRGRHLGAPIVGDDERYLAVLGETEVP